MAFEDNQKEPALPTGDLNYKRKVKNHLPKYFRTEFNNKFLNATLDRLLQPGVAEKISGYYGRQTSKAFTSKDNYITDNDNDRNNYRLEPVSLIKDDLNNVSYYADYNDFINTLKNQGNDPIDHSETTSQEYYAWNPHIDWDKFVNFREYYWLSAGPPTISVAGQSKSVQSTYTIGLANNADNVTYLFTPDGLTNNPTITLYRGQKYRFEIDTPNYPIAFATDKSFIPGSATLVETSAGIRAQGNFNVELYKTDENTDLIYSTGIERIIYETGFKEFSENSFGEQTVFVEKGVVEFTVPDNAPDYLYYISKNDPNVSGLFRINDIIENTEIDVEKEIIGKQAYKTTGDWFLSNGMKIKFVGNVLSAKYATGEWYVEGVGDAIQLIQQEDLRVSGLFTTDVKVAFDTTNFDYYPFGEALGFPVNKDYILINRGSVDGNLWSRYNRWFHKDVIKQSYELTNQAYVLDQTTRAKRAIIEFNAGLKLYNFGTEAKKTVDLLDTVTKDVFSTIEGSLGYNIDNVDLVDGMRILFIGDSDPMVYGKIYKVKFLLVNNRTQITLLEETDTNPLQDETVLISSGDTNSGKLYYYTGTVWSACQAKTAVNQAPLFDMYDNSNVQFNDVTAYQYSQFSGNKIFSYVTGTGNVDAELGFALTYRNIENTGDIVFNFNLAKESFTYVQDTTVLSLTTDKGFVRKYTDRTTFSSHNGWIKPDFNSSQTVIKQVIAVKDQENFALDMYDESDFTAHAWMRVYKNNKIQQKSVDYTIFADANDNKFLQFIKKCSENDIIKIKTRSRYVKNENGYYEIADSLEKNPLNGQLQDFTLGEVNDHLATIVEELDTFSGVYPGTSNLRDIGNLSKYGKKFLSHSCPMNLVLYHLVNKDANVLDSIDFARKEYSKFKRNFISAADASGYDGRTKPHVDTILNTLTADKVSSMPFYFSDMLPQGGTLVSSTVLIDTDQQYFPLSKVHDNTVLSNKAVSVYRNGNLSLFGIDYTFDSDGFVLYTGYKAVDDTIDIVEYDNTNGSFIPPTPTKLGLYPKYTPEIYIDTSVGTNGVANSTTVDTGSNAYAIYGQPVGAQYNNESIGWAYPVFTDIQNAKTQDSVLGGTGEAVMYKFTGLDRPFFMPKQDQNIAQQEPDNYPKWDEGIVVIQGHDGSITKAFLDYKDKLILELEKRIYNNCKTEYDPAMFDIYDFLDGLYRKNGVSRTKVDSIMLANFVDYTKLIDGVYTENTYYEQNNSFTYNYSGTVFENKESLPGWWRQIFRYAYDTDRPNTHPWEMLGFSQKPSWWDTQYGSGPYTSNNLLMWEDISEGIVRQPNFTVKPNYVRSRLLHTIPVDAAGKLISPNQSNLPVSLPSLYLQNNFQFGDGAPIENSWRKSSDYPFSLLRALVVAKPMKVFSTAFDRSRQKRNLTGQLVYGDTNSFIKLSNLVFPNTISDTTTSYASGLINYIIDYQAQEYKNNTQNYKDSLISIKNQLAFKVGGFTEKNKFRLILDSRTPLNEGNVFVPENNYDIINCKSAPIKEVVYSAVIIEKQSRGYVIKGYNIQNPKFYYYQSLAKNNDISINIGGVSEAFVTWTSQKTYAVNTIVKSPSDTVYYRCTETHTSEDNLDMSKFVVLPELPTIGGQNYKIRKVFYDYISVLEYGTLLPSIQDVADFIQGYGRYLEQQGFSFSRFSSDAYEISDWQLGTKQFVFWTTQNFNAGSVISISPGAHKINFSSAGYTVGNVLDTVNGYSILKANGKTIPTNNLKFVKDDDNTFSVKTVNTRSGIYCIKLPLITNEHAVIIDNKTDFNDIIYDIEPGYRQERIKVLGYRTDGWNGSVNLSGFVYDNAEITNWTQWKDYDIGALVKYKEFYYIARKKIAGSTIFRSNEWYKLDSAPEKQLLPNFDYKVKQFADFYSLDSDNFDAEQQKLAQHLIGYQKRLYLENIINDDVSQYKFYQGFIREKGTKNSLTKLFDVLSSANKDSLEFYEEWAVKNGQYGAADVFDEVEYILDESKFRLTPQPILLTDYITNKETDLIYRIPKYSAYKTPRNYDHKPFPQKYVDTTYVKNAGFVHPDDVQHIAGTYDSLTSLSIDNFNLEDYVWIGNVKNDWNVYQYKRSRHSISKVVTYSNSNDTWGVEITGTPVGFIAGDIITIPEMSKITYDQDDETKATFNESIIKGIFKIKSVLLNVIEFESTVQYVASVVSEDFQDCTGIIGEFVSVRAADLSALNRLAESSVEQNYKLWLDNDGSSRWGVLQNQNNYNKLTEIENSQSGATKYLDSYAIDGRNTWLIIGAPNENNGKVYVYNRPSQSSLWSISEELEPEKDDSGNPIIATNQNFGASVAISPDARYMLVGAPNASNIKNRFVGNYSTTVTYNQSDIVSYQNSFWQAKSNILQDQSSITFSSFQNYNDVFQALELDESASENIPFLLAGNYPYLSPSVDSTTLQADHFLLRVPKNVYDGVEPNDQITLNWNKVTNANQTQNTLIPRQPFDGNIGAFSELTLDKTHTIDAKVEVIISVRNFINVPQVADIITAGATAGRVVYVYRNGPDCTIYINDVAGNFATEIVKECYIAATNFVGEYVFNAPIETTDTSSQLSGYLMIKTDTYLIGQTNTDSGRGIVITDLILDSTVSNRFYYNINDYAQTTIESENTDHSLLIKLSGQQGAGPFGSTVVPISSYYMVRAPKALTDTLSAGSNFAMYFNDMKKTVGTLRVQNFSSLNLPPTLTKGETLTQANSGASAKVFSVTVVTDLLSPVLRRQYEIQVEGVTGTFNFTDKLTGSIGGDVDIVPVNNPVIGTLIQPSAIGIPNDTTTNPNLTVFDLWDGYIEFNLTEYLFGQTLEPIARYTYVSSSDLVDSGSVGQTVRDMNTGATAEVIYYERSGSVGRLYVKNIVGTWSVGQDFGDTQSIEMLAFSSGPNPDTFGRANVYTVNRTIGTIKKISLGYAAGGIGKLVVFKANQTIPVTTDNVTGQVTKELKDLEYWFYTQTTLAGVQTNVQTPGISSIAWDQVYKVTADSTAATTSYQNLGMCYIYEKVNNKFLLNQIILPADFKNNHYFGSKVYVTSNNEIGRAFVLASEGETVSNSGRLYFIKRGNENNIDYAWDYAKNKKFKGQFSAASAYQTDDIVYVDDAQDTDNLGLGRLYTAKTNIVPGSFNIQLWTLNTTLIDYVGYVPNTTGLTVRDNSDTDSSLTQENLYDFATDFDVSDNGEVLVVVAKYTGRANVVAVYRLNNGFYQWSQDLTVQSTTVEYGNTISVNNDGSVIVVGSPKDSTKKNNQGQVYVYKQVSGVFQLSQTLQSPHDKQAELFGYKVSCDGNKIVINAKNGEENIKTSFDKNKTYFDKKFTYFAFEDDDNGAVYIYEDVNGTYVYGDAISYTSTHGPVYYFGRDCKVIQNHVYVALPRVKNSKGNSGTIVDFSITNNVYSFIRQAQDTVDVTKIKRIILYNKATQTLVKYLDYIDPLQGKIAGPAEQNLSYKLYYDPAVYTISNIENVRADETDRWAGKHVGKLWWDLNNTKFYYPYQGDVTFAVNYWSDSFLSNTADIYEWIESDYLPSQWDTLADTTLGLSQGISGLSKYGDSAYSSVQIFDQISQSFSTKYYFWVKNKRTVPTIANRTISALTVSNLILDPAAQGYQFVALIANDRFAVYNCESLLENKDIVISFQYYTATDQTNNTHNEYQLITEGISSSKPSKNIEDKWIDSLVGFDNFGRIVPDYMLSEKEKYGNLNKPRQSWFVNREEALKQYIERVNSVLETTLIVDSKDLTKIKRSDTAPSSITRLYDVVLDTYAELGTYGVSSVKQATVNVSTVNGRITEIVITDPGKGYLVVPTFSIIGNGTGAEISFTINSAGSLSGVSIINPGKNYPISTQIEIRKFTALITADETLGGKWGMYERNTTLSQWDRIRSQGHNTNLYWEYIDWYASGYNSFTSINFTVDYSYELNNIDDNIGDVVKISNIGSGGWLLLKKVSDTLNVDYTINYDTIGRESGTLKFKDSLYNSSVSYNNFDLISFDTQLYDGIPSTETRNIIEAIRDDIFVNDLEIEYNKLFFASLRYVLSEQNYVDWLFKTSFIRAVHNVGEFQEDPTFNNASLPSYQSYVNEVKPFKAQIREYISSFEKTDNTQSHVSDFDLTPRYNTVSKKIEPYAVKMINDTLIGADAVSTYPVQSWRDNIGVGISSIEIADGGSGYTVPPVLRFTSSSGSGAVATASIGSNGSIINVKVQNSGLGYLAAPTISVDGSLESGGRAARLSVILSKPNARNIKSAIKFDRVSGTYEITNLDETVSFTGTGSKYIFDLIWPMDLDTTKVTVTVDNIELLTSEYSYENILDKTKTYDRYFGRLTLTTPAANNTVIKIVYKKNINLLKAHDRINLLYDPSVGQFGKDLSQVMDGIDYGGVEIKSFDFGQQVGWDETPWFKGEYDTYDTTYADEVITVDGSTTTLTLSKPLENGVLYNVYKNGVRLDDPDWTDDSTIFANPNAVIRSITGDGTTNTIQLQELGISTVADDIIIVRKTTSDGSFLPNNIDYDTLLSGGDLNYSNAVGISAEDIVVDGEGFITPVNCKGPEEVIPGQVQDSLDLTVYERPTGGTYPMLVHNHIGDGTTKQFTIGNNLVQDAGIFVKINNVIIDSSQYTIDYDNLKINFNTAPSNASSINVVSFGYSGTKFLDIDTFVADGSTSAFLTNIRYSIGVQALVTIDGVVTEAVLRKSDDSSVYDIQDNILITLAVPPADGKLVKYALFEGPQRTFSTVTIDKFTYEGSSTAFDLSKTPFTGEPSEWKILVKVNNNILNAGYVETFAVSALRQYRLKLHQVPQQSVSNQQLRVFLNSEELYYTQQWSFKGSAQYDPLVPDDQQSGSTITLFDGIGTVGDVLRIYINGWDDSTQSGGDYRFGYFDNTGAFVQTPGILHINTALNTNDAITVYQFSDHDSLGIDRQSFDIIERTELTPGTFVNTSTHIMDGSTSEIQLNFELLGDKQYAVFLNGVRLDDPNYGTAYQLNNDAKFATIQGNGARALNLDNLGIAVAPNDYIEIAEIDAEFVADEGTADWYEFRQLRNGIVPLQYPVIDDQYVWIVKNGALLSPSVDYFVLPDKKQVKLIDALKENDVIESIHFGNKKLQNKFAWRQFKDILNRNHYKAVDSANNCQLAKDLHWYDRSIEVVNAGQLPVPNENTKFPGVIFIDAERIEYFIKDGNFLKQLRRGTLGTAAKTVHAAGSLIYDQSIDMTMPYTDETVTTVFTGDNATNEFTLDFTPASGTNSFEVFVAGKRLRKTTLESYEADTVARTAYATSTQNIAQDSPEGDITLPAEFSLTNDNKLKLLNTPATGQKIIVIRRLGKRWTDPGTSLSESNNDIVNFLQSKQPDLPR